MRPRYSRLNSNNSKKSWFSKNIGWIFDEQLWGCWIVIILIAASTLCGLAVFAAQVWIAKSIILGG